MQGTEVPEHRKGYLLKSRSSGRCPHRKRRKPQPHQPAPGTNEPGAPAPSQTSDSHKQARPSTTREFLRGDTEQNFSSCSFLGSAPIQYPFCSRAPSPTTDPHGDGELLPRSIADNGSSWRRGAVPAFHRRQRVLMETGTLTMTSLCCEHVCRQLSEASNSCRTICIRCRARQNTEYGKMYGSHFQKNPNTMYSSDDATDIEHEQE